VGKVDEHCTTPRLAKFVSHSLLHRIVLQQLKPFDVVLEVENAERDW
jgi:hypothetical protein